MGPVAAIGAVFSQYFNVSGRASRSEFWWYSAFQFVILLACICVDIAMLDPETGFSSIWNSATVIFFCLTLIPNFTVAVRRLHDTGRSGFWMLIPMVPIVGGLWYFVLLCLPGEQDDNYYGQPFGQRASPKSPDLSDPFMIPKTQSAPKRGLFSRGPPPPSIQEQQAARRAEVLEYYNRRVLNKEGAPA